MSIDQESFSKDDARSCRFEVFFLVVLREDPRHVDLFVGIGVTSMLFDLLVEDE